MKKLIITLIIVLVGIGAFFYFTRPVKVTPNENISNEPTFQEPAQANEERYQINQEDSIARFKIDETLNGSPFTAIGSTSQISGAISIKHDEEKSTLDLAPIHVDARTFKTDNAQRDGAINRFILKTTTASNEKIVFTSSENITIPNLKNDESVSLSIKGDLTISGITKPATFDATLTKKSNSLLASLKTTLKRSDYSLTIPNIPFVANVSDEFSVEANIVANKI